MLAQSDLFAQERNLNRVSSNISPTILKFFANNHGLFHVAELIAYVQLTHPHIVADSVSRIMRLLRRSGKLNYKVVNRAASLYQIVR